MRPLILLFLLLLVGCAKPQVWARPGATQQEFAHDKVRCQALATAAAGAPPVDLPTDNPATAAGNNLQNAAASLGYTATREQAFKDCMIGEGWTLAQS